jgi:hypothetical protein
MEVELRVQAWVKKVTIIPPKPKTSVTIIPAKN